MVLPPEIPLQESAYPDKGRAAESQENTGEFGFFEDFLGRDRICPSGMSESLTMNYPLGSFPQFGYQASWAAERRERAIANSIATRQANAFYNLRIEAAFFNLLNSSSETMTPLSPEAEVVVGDFKFRMARIRRKLESGKRVYYRYLAETLVLFCDICGINPELKKMSDDALVEMVRRLGEENLK